MQIQYNNCKNERNVYFLWGQNIHFLQKKYIYKDCTGLRVLYKLKKLYILLKVITIQIKIKRKSIWDCDVIVRADDLFKNLYILPQYLIISTLSIFVLLLQ